MTGFSYYGGTLARIANGNRSRSVHPAQLAEWLAIPADELAARSRVPLTICPSKAELYRHFAQEMFGEIAEAARRGDELR